MYKSSSLLTYTGIAMIIAACVFYSLKNNDAGLTFILCGVPLALVGGLIPATIEKLAIKIFGLDFNLTRIATPKEIKLAIATDAEIEAGKVSEQTEQRVEDTNEIQDAKRSASDYLILATDNWKSKNYIEAITYAQQGLRLAPESKPLHAALLSRMGTIWYDLKDTNRAEHFYNNAIEIDPKYATAHNNLGVLLNNLNRNEEAEEEYRTAIKLDPKFAPAHNNLGNLLHKLDRNEEAEEEYRTAIKLDPEYASALRNLKLLQQRIKEK